MAAIIQQLFFIDKAGNDAFSVFSAVYERQNAAMSEEKRVFRLFSARLRAKG